MKYKNPQESIQAPQRLNVIAPPETLAFLPPCKSEKA
jgi:hypothetical protein